jgi:adenine-specific DNA-methyltransferase
MDDLTRKYVKSIGDEHRRAFGQFFTPPEVAKFMCGWVLKSAKGKIFDPAVGLGEFFRAAKSLDASVECEGAELDREVLEFLTANDPELAAMVKQGDYLLNWGGSHAHVVCNPPYMRFQKFLNRDAVAKAFATHLKIRLSGYTNIASAFLLKSISELKPHARLAYLMPLEFLNTGYGEIIKRRMLDLGVLKALVRFRDEKEVFPDAITSVGLILVANDGIRSAVQFHSVGSISELKNFESTPASHKFQPEFLDPRDKWLRHFESPQREVISTAIVPLNYYGTFRRGIATGANEFFAINRSTAKRLKISQDNLLPCISKSAQIRSRFLDPRNIEQLLERDETVLLLNLQGKLDEAGASYIRHGESLGYHLRYLTKVRNPWYKVERRSAAPILFGVFSRGIFKVVRNASNALNLTCFHGFHPNLFGSSFTDRLFLYFQSQTARNILGRNMRSYGDSLNKFEPNDLNRAMVPSPEWLEELPDDLVARALAHCRNHGALPEELEILFEKLEAEAEGMDTRILAGTSAGSSIEREC